MEFKEFLFDIVFFLFKGNRDFFKLINEFIEKLPPKHKRAKVDSIYIPFMTIMSTREMQMNLTTSEIDLFHKKLETFNYNKVIFKRKAIKHYSENIQRLLREAGWEKFGVALVQSLLEDETFKHSKPYLFGYKIGKIICF